MNIPCWTIEGGAARRGWTTTKGQLLLGEPGRGRLQTAVPVPPGTEYDAAGTAALSVPRPTRATEAVAGILVRDHSGFRGSWQLTAFAERMCDDAAHVVTTCDLCAGRGEYFVCPNVRQHVRDCGSCGGCGARRLPVPRARLAPTDVGVVIAKGWRGQGDAGRMGGGPEYLIAARPGRFCIERSGRTYAEPWLIGVTVTPDGTVTVDDRAAAIRATAAAAAWS